LDDHARIIRNTLASRWWVRRGEVDEKPAIGVVYGPHVFEHNISRRAVLKPVPKSKEEQIAAARRSGFAAWQRLQAAKEAS
jgi:hypothetical protein